jgi:hypothetical protein
MAETATTTTWQLEGTLLIACNCEYGCPCNFNAPPSQGHCEGQWLWHVESGSFGDVSLDGLTWTVTADWPGAIHEGGGRAVSFFDERADAAQREAIESLVRGEAGGPWAIFSNTYDLEEVRPVPVDLHLDGLETRAKLGDAVELELTAIKNPVTGEAVHPGAVLPEGLVCKEMSFGTSETFKVNDGVRYDHSGKYGAVAPFAYSSDD